MPIAPPAVDLAPVKRALNQRDFAQAERLLEAVLDEAPDSPDALTLMGVLHECLGQVHGPITPTARPWSARLIMARPSRT